MHTSCRLRSPFPLASTHLCDELPGALPVAFQRDGRIGTQLGQITHQLGRGARLGHVQDRARHLHRPMGFRRPSRSFQKRIQRRRTPCRCRTVREGTETNHPPLSPLQRSGRPLGSRPDGSSDGKEIEAPILRGLVSGSNAMPVLGNGAGPQRQVARSQGEWDDSRRP